MTVLDLGALVPEVEHAPGRVVDQVLVVRARGRRHDSVAVCCGRTRAGGTTTWRLAHSRLTSHSHGAGHGLVEVVDVEDEIALGAGELPEVADVRVAARLHADAGRRRGREVHRHDRRATAEERERRLRHPAVPHRDELGNPRLRLLLEHRDRIATGGPPSQSASDDRGTSARRARPASRRSPRVPSMCAPPFVGSSTREPSLPVASPQALGRGQGLRARLPFVIAGDGVGPHG